MARAAAATLLIGYALAIALTALHIVAGTPGSLFREYWPAGLVITGLAGLRRGLGWALWGRWIPAALVVTGGALLAGRLAHVAVGTLALAALLAWAGLAVALGGQRGGGTPQR